MPEVFRLAAVAVLVVVLILLVLIVVLILLVLLILILVIHSNATSVLYLCGMTAEIAYPEFQDLSFALKIRLASRPAVMAAAIPPAVAFRPPVSTPRNPLSFTASFTPFARL